MFNLNKYKTALKIIFIGLFVIIGEMVHGQATCVTAIPYVDNSCVFISPPTAGPVTRCYKFISPEDSIDFDFTPYGPIGTCDDAITSINLYDDNCNFISTNDSGEFAGLTIDQQYRVCFTVTCPTTGVINLICTQELNALPIELIYFIHRIEYNSVRLLWATGSETNNSYFIISKSTDFVIWTDIGTVNGANTSNVKLTYSFLYNGLTEGVSYFRLSQVDNDGTVTPCETIAVIFNVKNKSYDIFERYNILGQEAK